MRVRIPHASIICLIIVAFSFFDDCVLAQDAVLDQELREIEVELQDGLDEAAEQYNSAVEAATKEFRIALESEQKQLVQAGDLDAAMQIRERISNVEKRIAQMNPTLRTGNSVALRNQSGRILSALEGRIWEARTGGWNPPFRFATDGYVVTESDSKKIARWTLVGAKYVVTRRVAFQSRDVMDVFSLDNDGETLHVTCIGSYATPQARWIAVSEGK